jgi:hypothetical protein
MDPVLKQTQSLPISVASIKKIPTHSALSKCPPEAPPTGSGMALISVTRLTLATTTTRNQWIQYTFEKWRMGPTHYASRSYFNGRLGDANPKSGVIQGSNDGIPRTEIDQREENSKLNA